ncbi:MAG TPA: hypothetical protein VIK32_08195, partial [Candidatus Limnocylindrales bacterium]
MRDRRAWLGKRAAASPDAPRILQAADRNLVREVGLARPSSSVETRYMRHVLAFVVALSVSLGSPVVGQ